MHNTYKKNMTLIIKGRFLHPYIYVKDQYHVKSFIVRVFSQRIFRKVIAITAGVLRRRELDILTYSIIWAFIGSWMIWYTKAKKSLLNWECDWLCCVKNNKNIGCREKRILFHRRCFYAFLHCAIYQLFYDSISISQFLVLI